MSHHRVAVIGSGVVGQATGRGFLARGIAVTFVDTNLDKVQSLREEGLVACTPTELAEREHDVDVTVLTVSTPTHEGKIDLTHLRAAAEDLGRRLAHTSKYHVVVVRSTVVPGTTEDLVAASIEKFSGRQRGKDFGLCMNPEYLREKTSVQDFHEPWIVVIGQYDQRSGNTVAALYRDFPCPIFRVTLREAEAQKYVHNLFNAVKITFFNELRQVCRHAGIDSEAIFPLVAQSAEGMWNPAYGTKDYGPFDGMCLPKDTQAFLHWAQTNGWEMPLLATAITVNNELTTAQSAPQADPVAAAKDVVAASAPAG